MRILHVVPSHLPAHRFGGPVYAIHELCKAQQRLGHDVTVATTNVDVDGLLSVETNTEKMVDEVRVWYFSVARPVRRLCLSLQLIKWLRSNLCNFDVIHIHSLFLFPTAYALIAAKVAGLKYVLSPRGMIDRTLIRGQSFLIKSIYLIIFKKYIERADFIHATSERECKSIREYFPNIRICTIPNGVTPNFNNIKKWAGKDIDLLYIGRLSRKKRIHLLVQALKFLGTAKLCIAGPSERGERENLLALSIDIGVGDRIEWHDYVGADEKAELFGRSKLFVLPSINENFGNVVLESYSFGVPVALTEGVGLSDWVVKNGIGWLIPDEPAAVAACCREALGDLGVLEERGLRGARRLLTDFAWTSVANNLVTEYLGKE